MRKNSLKRIVAFFMAFCVTLSMSNVVYAAPADNDTDTKKCPDYSEHDSHQKGQEIMTMDLESGMRMISNEYIEFMVDDYGNDSGRFTIGNVEGNPNYSSDDDEILLYGHSDPWSSYTTIRIDGVDYMFEAEENLYDTDTKTAVSVMTIDEVLVTQTLQIVNNNGTGLADTVKISYTVENLSDRNKTIGIRIMMDTMLGNNDGAPFKVPSLGNVTCERELIGNEIPQFWQAFDDLENPSVFAVGTLYSENDRKPDKVQFASWGEVYSSHNAWNYTIDPERSVTGDSAVAIYWNPVSIAGNESTSVCTYYGAGRSVDNESAGTNIEINANGFGVQIIEEDGTPINGASVTVENVESSETVVTDESGMAVFDSLLQGAGVKKEVTLRIEREEYLPATVSRLVYGGALTSVTIYKDDGKAHIVSARAEIDGNYLDLLNNYKYFKENVEDTEAAVDGSNVRYLNIDVTACGTSEIRVYQLLQGGEVVIESDSSEIQIPVYTGTGEDSGKFGDDWRIDELEAGKAVYLRIIDENGNASEQKLLGLKISKPVLYGMTETEGTFSFGDGIKVTVPSGVPILGDTEIEFEWDGIPFEFEITDEGKVKFAINHDVEDEDESGSIDWDKVKKNYEEKKKKADDKKLNPKDLFGKNPLKFTTASIEVSAGVSGYGEGSYDENGNITVNLGMVLTLSEEGEITWTYFLGYVPVYIAVGEKVEMTTTGQLTIVASDGNISITGADMDLEIPMTLNIDGGVGANGVLHIGASGRLTLTTYSSLVEDYLRADLSGGVYLVAQAFMFKAEKKFAEKTWTLYDSNNPQLLAEGAVEEDAGFFQSSSYTPIDRHYLNTPAPLSLSADTVKYSVYPDASPVLVQAGDKDYLFWLEDIAERSANDRTALVYSVRDTGGYWSDPIAVIEETENSTADLAFDLCYDGTAIHLAISKASQRFGEDESITIDTIAASSEVYYMQLNPLSGEVSQPVRLTENEYADLMPAVFSNGEKVVVAYAENRMEDGFFGTENTHNIVYAEVGETVDIETAAVDGLISDLNLGVVGNTIAAAYILDTDKNYETEADLQLYVFNGSTNSLFAADEAGVVNPQFAELGSDSVLMWYANGNVYYSNDSGSSAEAATVFTQVPSTWNRNFRVLDGSDDVKIIWTGISDSADANTAVYAVSYADGAWGSAYKLFDVEKYNNTDMISALSGYSANETTYVAYMKTEGIEYDEEISSLYVAEIEPHAELALYDVTFDASEVKPGEVLPITLTVENKGQKHIESITVTEYLTDFETVITNADLGVGETKTYSINDFSVLSTATGPESYEFGVYCEEEYQNSDNYQIVKIGYVDLKLETTKQLVNSNDCLNIVVQNLTDIPTDAVLRITADEKDGAILYEANIRNLSKDSLQTFLVDLTALNANTNIDTYYVFVDAAVEELLESDNEEQVYTALGREKTYKLNVSSTSGGYVTGDIGGQFTPGTELTVSAVNDRFYRFTEWTAASEIEITDRTASTITFIMPEHDVTLTANFEDISISTSLNQSYMSLTQGDNYQLTAYLNSNEDLQDTLFWQSSDPTVATVSASGVVTAVGTGTAIISFGSTDERVRPSYCEVTVHAMNIVTDLSTFESLHNYEDRSYEQWAYTIPDAEKIELTFDERTEFESGCDYLYIYDGNGDEFGAYSGTELAGKTLIIPGNNVKLLLTSDGSFSCWGFKITAAAKHVHSNTVKTEQAATCTKDGFKTYVCGTCGEETTETLKFSGHNWTAASCTAPKTCKVCGVTEGSASGHDWKAASCTAPKTCKVCGATEGNANSHDWKAASCIAPKTCKVCGKTEGSVIAHANNTTIVKATLSKDGKITTICSICGINETKTIPYVKKITLAKTKYTYNGKVITPQVTVKDNKGNVLKKDTDYTVTYAKGRKNTGQYAVTIKFKGNYSGEKKLYFKIVPSKTSRITTANKENSIKASWESVKGASGYKVELLNAKGKVLKNEVTTKRTYTFKKLSKRETYKIRVTAYKTISGKKEYASSGTTVVTSTALTKMKISKVSAGSKSAIVSWKALKGVSGYEVTYSTSSKFTKVQKVTIKNASAKKTTIKKLKKGQNYYFKVRAYKTINGKKVYGEWSSAKKVRIK